MRKAINIKWDVDEAEDLKSLPSELQIPEDVSEGEVSDYISDITGYCHFGYELTA